MSRLNFESIYWNGETKLINLTQEEFKDKVDSLEGYTRIPLTSSVDKYLFEKCYSVRKSYNNLILYMVDNGKFVRYGTNWLDSTKNETHGTGSKAISLVLDKFTEVTGSTFCKAFGTVEERFKRNVPKQFIYTNPKHLNKQKRLGSIDACSHYPANMRGRLPDAHTAIIVKGRVEPSEEYPFAFYKSGHCAEYQVFDTHNWLGHKYYCMNLFRYDFKKEDFAIQNVPDELEETTLMKASDYQLDEVYNYFYHIKSTCTPDTPEYQDAKLVMNASIGMMHKKNYDRYKYAHLVAIALCRANQKILDMCSVIGDEWVAHVCVDGIMYVGPEIYGNTDKKVFGEYYQEFYNCIGKISATNRYIILDENSHVEKAKWGGMTNYTDGRRITLESIVSLDDQYNWVRVDPLEELKNEKTL